MIFYPKLVTILTRLSPLSRSHKNVDVIKSPCIHSTTVHSLVHQVLARSPCAHSTTVHSFDHRVPYTLAHSAVTTHSLDHHALTRHQHSFRVVITQNRDRTSVNRLLPLRLSKNCKQPKTHLTDLQTTRIFHRFAILSQKIRCSVTKAGCSMSHTFETKDFGTLISFHEPLGIILYGLLLKFRDLVVTCNDIISSLI